MLLKNKFLLLEGAGDGQGGGGAPGTVLGGGGGAPANSGNANPGSGNPPGGTGNPPAAGATDVRIPDNWKLALAKELQEDPSLKAITDVSGLAKSYINAQKLVGADKIPVPSKHATDEDWRGVFHKLGLPADAKEYDVKKPANATFDDKFLNPFKEVAYKAGLLPKQAQTLVEWFSEANGKAMNEFKTTQATNHAKELDVLKAEWGAAYEAKVSQARQVLNIFGDDNIKKHLENSGLGNDTQLIRFLAKIGEEFKEGAIKGGGGGAGSMKSPDEAKKAIASVMGEGTHPYHIKTHPGHGTAVAEMAQLFEMAYPTKK